MGIISLFYSFPTRLQGSLLEVPSATPKTVAPKLFIHYVFPVLFMSPCFRSRLYPRLKRSGALISQADCCGGVLKLKQLIVVL